MTRTFWAALASALYTIADYRVNSAYRIRRWADWCHAKASRGGRFVP